MKLERRRRARRNGTILAFLLALLLYGFVHTFCFEGFRVASASMAETLVEGDRVIANKWLYGARVPFLAKRVPGFRRPIPGDILFFEHPDRREDVFVKRCVAVGGQRVQIDDGILFVDGVIVEPPTTAPKEEPTDRYYGPVDVPDGMLFVLGDNRAHSSDSRDWGLLPEDLVIGRADRILWSIDPDRSRVRWSRVGRSVR